MDLDRQTNSKWITLPAIALAATLLALVFPVGVRAQEQPATTSSASAVDTNSAGDAMRGKLNSIVIDKIDFQQLDVAVAVQFLSAKSKELDPDRKGINIVLNLPPDAPHVHRQITLELDNVPLRAVLDYITQQTNLECTVDAYAVYLHPVVLQGNSTGLTSPAPASNAGTGSTLIQSKLNSMTLSLNFSNATIDEATDFLMAKSKELDPDKKGINFVFAPQTASSAKPITLALNNVSMGEALRYISDLAGVQYKVGDSAVEIAPLQR